MTRAVSLPLLLAGIAVAACSSEESTNDDSWNGLSDGSANSGAGGASGADGSAQGGTSGVSGSVSFGGAGGTAVDASADIADPCSGLDEEACNKEVQNQKCWAYYGWKVPDGTKHFVLCDVYCSGGAAESCSVSPSGECYLFPDTCAPTGWTFVADCNSDASASCAGAFEIPTN